MPPGGLGGSGGVAVGAATRAPPANDPGPTSRSKEPYTISFPSLVRQIRATVTDSAQLESVQALVDDFADRRVEPASVQQRLSQIVGKSVVRSAISTLIRARKQAAVDDGARPAATGAVSARAQNARLRAHAVRACMRAAQRSNRPTRRPWASCLPLWPCAPPRRRCCHQAAAPERRD